MLFTAVLCGLMANALCQSEEIVDTSWIPYAQIYRDVTKAQRILDQHLVKKNYSVLDPNLHYLAIVGVVYKTASHLAEHKHADADALFRKNVEVDVPKLLSNPNALVDELNIKRRNLHNILDPFFDLVRTYCSDKEDYECNHYISELGKKDVLLLIGFQYLLATGPVARDLVALEPELLEASETFAATPYLLENQEDLVQYIKVLAKLLHMMNIQ